MAVIMSSNETRDGYTCKPYPGGIPYDTDQSSLLKEFSDPAQGNTDNCCLIAALSAIDWTMGRTKIKIIQRGTNYYVYFGDTPKTVTNTLSLDGNNNFQFAHSINAVNELWPGIYEKATAKYIHGSTQDCNFNEVDWDGNPTRYLKTFSACKDTTVNSYLYSNIVGRCRDGKTLYPMVIWNDNHCYTVLGYQPNGYIVLRDPKPEAPIIPPNAIISGTWDVNDHFLWDCRLDTMIASRGKYTVYFGFGIFAISQTDLQNYFTHLTFVKGQAR